MDVSCSDEDVRLAFGTVSALHVTGTAALGGQEGEDIRPAHLLLACQSGELGLMINQAPQLGGQEGEDVRSQAPQLGGKEGEDVRQPSASGLHRPAGPSVEDGGAGASYSEPEWTLTQQNWLDCPPYEPCAFPAGEHSSVERLHNNGAFLPLTCGESGWSLGVMKTKHDTAKSVSNDAKNLEHGPGVAEDLEHGPGVAAPLEGVHNAVLTTVVADTTAWRLEHGPGCVASFESLVRLLKSSVDHDLHEQQRG